MLGLGLLAFAPRRAALRQDDARRAQDDGEAAARRRLRRGRARAGRDQDADAPARRAADGRKPPGFWRGAIEVARVELRELRNAPGLYLFIPLILLQTIGATAVALGPFGTFVLATPGTIAVRMMNTLTLLVDACCSCSTRSSRTSVRSTPGWPRSSTRRPCGPARSCSGSRSPTRWSGSWCSWAASSAPRS